MTTAARFANHGSTASAKGSPGRHIPGCDCLRCGAALARYNHRLQQYRSHVHYDTVPAQPVIDYLRHLFDEGAGWTQLTAAANCSTSTIRRLRAGEPTPIHADAACRILALRPDDARAPWRPVDATGSMRRVRALAAIGHQRNTISARSGVANEVIGLLLNGTRKVVDPRTADRIADAYERMRWAPGTAHRMRNRAMREGWPTPLAWDRNIDDPEAVPDVDTTPEIKLGKHAEARLIAEEIRHLASLGEPLDQISKRFNKSVKYIRAQLGPRGTGWRKAAAEVEEAAA